MKKSLLKTFSRSNRPHTPSLWASIVPVALLLISIISIIALFGPGPVQDYSYIMLIGASLSAILIAWITTSRSLRHIIAGIKKSASQIMPAIPVLIFIGTLSSTWMLSGVVPMLIHFGLQVINPTWFLLIACIVSALVSVVTGSSWTTIATIGVAFIGIGTVMGFSPAWIAGAIISGAYFGDKVSPLSDTTVLAASTCKIDLFTHIRFLMLTTIPAMTIALAVYALVGFMTKTVEGSHATEMINTLTATFNLTPWVLIIPAISCALIAFNVRTDITLAIGSIAGLLGIFIFQPQVLESISNGPTTSHHLMAALKVLVTDSGLETGNELLNPLLSTSGVLGMTTTILLVLSAMIFGGVMIGTGMLGRITSTITHRINRARSLVTATVGSGLFLNSCTGDQYLSIIIGGNVYKNTYNRLDMRPQVLSRALEDSISVTSVLIPWNSCGVTQSTVLGVATLTYLPCCVFNYLSPLMSIFMAWIGFKIHEHNFAKTLCEPTHA